MLIWSSFFESSGEILVWYIRIQLHIDFLKLWSLLYSVTDLIEQNNCRTPQWDKKEFVFWRCRFFFDNAALICKHIFNSPSSISLCNSVKVPPDFSLSLSVVIRSTLIHRKCHLFIKKEMNSVFVSDMQYICYSEFAPHCRILYMQAVKVDSERLWGE